MKAILCSTRGGLASQVTQKAALDLARATGLPLVYLYVVNTDFMRCTTELSHVDEAAREIAKLGEFILAIAVERAEAEGVKAEGIIRVGKWNEKLRAVVKEIQPQYVVLGSPGLDSPQERTATENLKKRGAELKAEFGVEVLMVLPTGECVPL